MARPEKTTPKAAPTGVSLYPHQRELFMRVGGSAWLQDRLDAIGELDPAYRRAMKAMRPEQSPVRRRA